MADMGSIYVTLGMRMTGIANAQRTMLDALKRIEKQAELTNARLAVLEKQAKATASGVGKSFQQIPVGAEAATTAIDKMTASIFRSAQRWRTFGYLATLTMTAPMVLAGKAALDTAGEFDFAMNKMVGLVGLSKGAVEGLRKELLKMAPIIGQTPQALAEAAYFATSAGFKDVGDALSIIETGAKMASAGMGTAADNTKVLVFAMNAYRASGMTATKAGDIFTAAVREGAIETEGFATAMQSVLPIASRMGVGLEQLAGAMAAMSLQGASAANSAVYLKGMLNSLLKIKPTNQAGKALAAMGVNAQDLYDELKKPNGLMNVLMKLQDLSNKSTGNIFLKQIFTDIRAMTGALSLLGENLKYNQYVMDQVAKAGGDVAFAFGAVQDQIKFFRNQMKATGDVIKIEFGEVLAKVVLPVLNKWLERIKRLLDAFTEMSPMLQRVIIKVLGLVAAIGPLALIVSVLKYAYGGFFSFFGKRIALMRSLVKGLKGEIIGLSAVAKTSPWLANLGNTVSLKATTAGGWAALAKNVGKAALSFGRMAGPVALMATGLVAGTIKLFKYSNQIKEVAKNNDIFNKSMVEVGGVMMKFNELAMSDISNMSFLEMIKAQETARKVWKDSYDMILQYQKNIETGAGSKRLNKKAMKEENEQLMLSKNLYEALGAAIARYVQTEMNIERKTLADAIKADADALQEIIDTMNESITSAKEMDKVHKAVGKSFDLNAKLADIYFDAIEKLVSGDHKLKFESPEVQKIVKDLKALGIDFTKVDTIVENFNQDLKAIGIKKSLLPNFDADTAKLQLFERQINKVLDEVMKRPGMIATDEDKKQLAEYVKGMEEAQRAIDAIEDTKLLKFLNAQSAAFGGVENQVEVLNGQLQIAERKLRQIGENEGFSENFKRQAESVNQLRESVRRLNQEADLQYLIDMNNAMKTSGAYMNLLDGLMSAMEEELQRMSRAGLGATQMFQDMATKLKTLSVMKTALEELQNAFYSVFRDLLDGGKNFSDIMIGLFKDMIAKIMSELAMHALFKIIMTIATSGVGAGAGSVLVARGGVVPQGYPNDSYPALLTSGETVLPKKLTPDRFKSDDDWSGQVVFEIGQDKLVGILQKAVKKNSIY